MVITADPPGTSAPQTPTPCDPAAVGQRLRGLRREAGLTQSDLVRRRVATQSSVARLEAGRQGLSLAARQPATVALGCDVTVVVSEQRAV